MSVGSESAGKRSFKSIIADVKTAYNIVDVITASGVVLKRQGMKWKGLCPFHNEKTPSFNVDESFQSYRCFGCGEHGDVISFVEKSESLSFTDALIKLADEKGIAVDSLNDNNDGIDYRSLRECLRSTANFFYKSFAALEPNHPARREVASRGVTVGKMRYGYAPEGRTTLYQFLSGAGFSDETILHAGVCKRSEKTGKFFDFWQGRLMFFVTDAAGRVSGFSGRKLFESDRMGKYVNSPEGPLFDKSSSLFNVDAAKKKAMDDSVLYIAEGQFDVAAMVEAGMTNTVASLGTAFTPKQGSLARRMVGEEGRLVFCFDGDEAGQAAALKTFDGIPSIHLQSYVVSFPDGGDPCDYRLANGNEALVDFVSTQAIPLVQFVLNAAVAGHTADDPHSRAQYVNAAARVLATVTSGPLRDTYARTVALNALVSVDTVLEAVNMVSTTGKKPETPSVVQSSQSANEDSTPVLDERARLLAADVQDEETQSDESVSAGPSSEELVSLIGKDRVYASAARLVTLILAHGPLRARVDEVKSLIPDGLNSVIEDVRNQPGVTVTVPEMFRDSALVEYLIGKDFFPFAHLMDENSVADQFAYLVSYLTKTSQKRKSDEARLRAASVLHGASDSADSAVLLEKALSLSS